MMQVAALSIFIRVVQRLQSEVPRTPPVVSIRDRKSIGVRSGTKGKMPNPARRFTLSRVLIQPLISTSRPAACPAERKVWNPPQLPGRVVRPLHRARRLAAPWCTVCRSSAYSYPVSDVLRSVHCAGTLSFRAYSKSRLYSVE